MSLCVFCFANRFYAVDGLEWLLKCLAAYYDSMCHLMMCCSELMRSYSQQLTMLFQGSVRIIKWTIHYTKLFKFKEQSTFGLLRENNNL